MSERMEGTERSDTRPYEPFEGTIDSYNGITVKPKDYGDISVDVFRKRLTVSLKLWRENGRRGAWLKIPMEKSHFIPVAVELGYVFHHAQPGYLMLTQWLSVKEKDNLPPYACFYIGVGGLVVNDKDQVLAVQERFAIGGKRHWKLPGGHVDMGEDLPTAVLREVQEETGVKTEFLSLLCFRHMRGYRYGCSDIYFICLLKPAEGAAEPQANQDEIHECRWMDIHDYRRQELTATNRLIIEAYLKGQLQSCCMSPSTLPHYFKGRPEMQFFSLQHKEVVQGKDGHANTETSKM